MKCPQCRREAASIERSEDYSNWYCAICNIFFWDYQGEYLNWKIESAKERLQVIRGERKAAPSLNHFDG